MEAPIAERPTTRFDIASGRHNPIDVMGRRAAAPICGTTANRLVRGLERRARALARSLGLASDASIRSLNDDVKRMLGDIETSLQPKDPGASVGSVEFRVFSQFGEDGIIQHLLRHADIQRDFFVEIGVEDYRESNTRFLLQHNNWEGVIIDSGDAHVTFLERSMLRWRHSVDPVTAFVEPDGVNALLAAARVPDAPGLLSIDIDGMDYWILEELAVRPSIVVAEYNSHFGPTAAVSVPYSAGFERTRAHHSNLYFGASLTALDHWARGQGYRLFGCTTGGNNAFFVRDDVAGDLPDRSPAEAYVRTRVREAKDTARRLTYRVEEALRAPTFQSLPLIDVKTGEALTVRDVLA